jgi:ankyrin repeat protein
VWCGAALHHAAAAGYGTVVHKLVIAGSLVRATDRQGLTAGHLAAKSGLVDALESLVKGGFWVDTTCAVTADGVTGFEGATALHLAAQYSDSRVCDNLHVLLPLPHKLCVYTNKFALHKFINRGESGWLEQDLDP